MWQHAISRTRPWFSQERCNAILPNHLRSPLAPTIAALNVFPPTVNPSKKSCLKSAAKSSNSFIRALGCAWWIEEGMMNSGQWCKRLCPFIVVVCSSKIVNCSGERSRCKLLNLCFKSSGGLQAQVSIFLFREFKTVFVPMAVSHDTTTVLPRRLPRPSSPCQNNGRTHSKLLLCSAKIMSFLFPNR